MKEDVGRGLERHRTLAPETQSLRAGDVGNEFRNAIGIARFGHFARKPKLTGRIRPVPAARGGKAPHELDADAADLVKEPPIAEQSEEGRPGTHRAHRMGGRGADPHAEHIEDADSHVCVVLFLAVVARARGPGDDDQRWFLNWIL